jgi:hypothetical protein
MNRPQLFLRNVLSALLIGVAGLALPGVALACGGFYGGAVMVAPSQKILVIYRDGVETYVFGPNFCGSSKDFGLILPIPAPLTGAPSVAGKSLLDDVDSYTAPATQEMCQQLGCGLGGGGVDEIGPDAGFNTTVAPKPGVIVIDKGTVGQFDYELLQATSTQAFTDWLSLNGFPQSPTENGAYDHYVSKQWYFVAFKISADTADAPSGSVICGALGPIQLSFASPGPVVPARIAAVNADPSQPQKWRVSIVADHQQKLSPTSSFAGALNFAHTLKATDLVAAPTLAGMTRDGERLTTIDVTFATTVADDIALEADADSDFRSTKVVYLQCDGGCATGASGPTGVLMLVVGAGLYFAMRRRPVRH